VEISFQPINAFLDAAFIAIFVPCKNQTYQYSKWRCLFASCFSFKFVAYQPLQRCQISCANKQQVEKIKHLCNVHCLKSFEPWLLRFLFVTKFKHTNGFSGSGFCWYFFLWSCGITIFSCANMHKVEKIKVLLQGSVLVTYKPTNALVDAVITANFVPFQNQT